MYHDRSPCKPALLAFQDIYIFQNLSRSVQFLVSLFASEPFLHNSLDTVLLVVVETPKSEVGQQARYGLSPPHIPHLHTFYCELHRFQSSS
jgi:hypothetical protein